MAGTGHLAAGVAALALSLAASGAAIAQSGDGGRTCRLDDRGNQSVIFGFYKGVRESVNSATGLRQFREFSYWRCFDDVSACEAWQEATAAVDGQPVFAFCRAGG